MAEIARLRAFFGVAFLEDLFDLSFGCVHELDERHRGVIAASRSDLHHASISTGALFESSCDIAEQFGHGFFVLEDRRCLSSCVQVASFTEGDQRFDDCPKLFGFGQCGCDTLVQEQGGCHIGQHRALVACGAIEFTSGFAVPHGVLLFVQA